MVVEQLVDEPFEKADLAAGGAVLFDEILEPFEPTPACWGRACGGVDVFEAAQPGFDLAGRGGLVAYLGGQLEDLVHDMVQTECACGYQGPTVLEHGLDLGHGSSGVVATSPDYS